MKIKDKTVTTLAIETQVRHGMGYVARESMLQRGWSKRQIRRYLASQERRGKKA